MSQSSKTPIIITLSSLVVVLGLIIVILIGSASTPNQQVTPENLVKISELKKSLQSNSGVFLVSNNNNVAQQSIVEQSTFDKFNQAFESNKGKIYIVNLWATWCGWCHREIPQLMSIYESYKSKGVEIIGISMDDQRSQNQVGPYVKEKMLNYAVLIANQTSGQTIASFVMGRTRQGLGLPTTLFYGKDGNLFEIVPGYESQQDTINRLEKMLKS